MKYYMLSQNQLDALVQYLCECKWKEVNSYINMLDKLPECPVQIRQTPPKSEVKEILKEALTNPTDSGAGGTGVSANGASDVNLPKAQL